MPVTTKLGRSVTCHEAVPPITSHDYISHGYARSRDKIKSLYNPFPQFMWLPNLAGWVHTMRSFLP